MTKLDRLMLYTMFSFFMRGIGILIGILTSRGNEHIKSFLDDYEKFDRDAGKWAGLFTDKMEGEG